MQTMNDINYFWICSQLTELVTTSRDRYFDPDGFSRDMEDIKSFAEKINDALQNKIKQHEREKNV